MYYVRRLGPAAPAVIIAGTLPSLGLVLLGLYLEPLGLWLRTHGAAGPVVYAAAFVPLGGLAIMPTWIWSALGGWTFGFWTGWPAALSGYVAAAMFGYALGRLTAGDRAITLLNEQPRWREIYEALLQSSPRRTLLIVFLVRLASSPFAVTNIVFSAAKVRPGIYFLGAATGLAPRTALVVWAASRFGGEHFNPQSTHPAVLWTGVAVAAVCIVAISLIARRVMDRVI